MHYVYVLRYPSTKFYIGCTNDLKRRINEHAQRKPGCRLVYYEAYANSKAAWQREAKLKQYGSAWRALKERLKES